MPAAMSARSVHVHRDLHVHICILVCAYTTHAQHTHAQYAHTQHTDVVIQHTYNPHTHTHTTYICTIHTQNTHNIQMLSYNTHTCSIHIYTQRTYTQHTETHKTHTHTHTPYTHWTNLHSPNVQGHFSRQPVNWLPGPHRATSKSYNRLQTPPGSGFLPPPGSYQVINLSKGSPGQAAAS